MRQPTNKNERLDPVVCGQKDRREIRNYASATAAITVDHTTSKQEPPSKGAKPTTIFCANDDDDNEESTKTPEYPTPPPLLLICFPSSYYYYRHSKTGKSLPLSTNIIIISMFMRNAASVLAALFVSSK